MMHMIRYKLRADRVAENERLAAAVYRELAGLRPAGLRYATFRFGDGVSFMHVVSHDEPDARNALTALASFQAFAAGVKERCEEPPVRVDLHEIGSYRFFGD